MFYVEIYVGLEHGWQKRQAGKKGREPSNQKSSSSSSSTFQQAPPTTHNEPPYSYRDQGVIMPNARVGAMPHPSGQQRTKKDRRGQAKDRKGITIEDLKQQTAQRLAKQQENRQRKNVRNHPQPKPKSSQTAINVQAQAQPAVPNQAHAYTHNSNYAYGGTARPSPKSFQQVQSFDTEHTLVSQWSSDLSAHNHSGPRTPNQAAPSSTHHNQYHQGHRSVHKNHDHGKSHSRGHHKKSPYVQLKVQKDSKLPQALAHGLTVQELKEMTRARLASEATDEGSVNKNNEDAQMNNNRQRVYSLETVRSDVSRPRIDSAESFRSAPATFAERTGFGFRNPFARSRSSSRLNNHQGISSYYSADAADNISVNSYVSGIGADSFVGSEASGIYTSSSRDLGKAVSFGAGEINSEYENEQFSTFMTSASFETGSRRLAATGYSSPGLSNLMEDKPFSPKIEESFSGEGRRFDFAGLPASPAVNRNPFSEDALADLLHSHPHQSLTPSTSRSCAFSDGHEASDEFTIPIPHLGRETFERQISRGGELPNSVAESVLGASDLGPVAVLDALPKAEGHSTQNPWEKNNQDGLSDLATNLNNLLLSESAVDDFPYSSFHSKSSIKKDDSDWTPVEGQPLTPQHDPNVVIQESFCDDGETKEGKTPPSKPANKKRSSSRWKSFI